MTHSKLDFRPEIGMRPRDLTERVRDLDARLRSTKPGAFSAEERRALASLLRTVHQLSLPSRFSHEA
ncbi:MAG TPA: hypothetical protein VFB50_16325 [Chloroflexota bacterium]|nr:hypothetical protein [Chloroflexota bacterium]